MNFETPQEMIDEELETLQKIEISDMEREIWDILKALDENKLTAIQAHKKLYSLYVLIKNKTRK